MVTGQLPKVRIDGKEYFMDARLKEFRRILTKEDHMVLPGLITKKFNEVSDENKVELVTPRQMITDDTVISCLTPKEYDELFDLGVKNKILKKIPICKND